VFAAPLADNENENIIFAPKKERGGGLVPKGFSPFLVIRTRGIQQGQEQQQKNLLLLPWCGDNLIFCLRECQAFTFVRKFLERVKQGTRLVWACAENDDKNHSQ
jgi:hypothetical protein